MQNNLCLYCGKPGHRARECKAKRGKGMPAATCDYNPNQENDDDLHHYLKATHAEPMPTSVQDLADRAVLSRPSEATYTPDEWEDYPAPLILTTPRQEIQIRHTAMSWTACYEGYVVCLCL